MPPKARAQDMVVSLDQVIALVRMLIEFHRTMMIMLFERSNRLERDRDRRRRDDGGGDDDDHGPGGGGGGKRAKTKQGGESGSTVT